MRIFVVGAGALGGLIGAQLSEAGEDVFLLEVNPARVKLLGQEGLHIAQESEGERLVQIRIGATVEGGAEADLVLFAVKSYQTESAAELVASVVGPETWLLSLQNGIGNTEVLAQRFGAERVLSGITYHSIQHMGPNRLRYRAGIKPIQIAPVQGEVTEPILAVGEVFRRAGINCEIVPEVDVAIWQKLLHNAVVNPVSALTGLTCRELLEDDDAQAFMSALCAEIVAVMKARGTPIANPEDPYEPVRGSQRALGKNRPSMWQDLMRGFRTEVDSINGAVIEEARRHQLEAPLNFGLVSFIHSRERWKILRKQEQRERVRAASEPAASPTMRAVGPGAGQGMPSGRIPLKVAGTLKRMLKDYYQDVEAAGKDPQRRVAWVSGLGPVEVVRAMGYTPYFPENHAALIGATREADRYISRSFSEGFSQFVGSAMACDVGAMLLSESPLGKAYEVQGPPDPEVIVYNTSNGHDQIHWFGYYGRRFEVPVIGLHPPAALDQVERIEVDAAVEQHLRMIARLESLAVRKIDVNRLSEVVSLSAQAAALWAEIVDLARHVPSPITYFDLLVHMAPAVMMRGTEQAVEYYRILKAELEERVADGFAAVPGERYRIYWEGPPIWGALRALAALFLERQVAVVASTFTNISVLEGLDPMNPIESMARVFTSIFPNRSEDYKANYLMDEFERFGVDGVIYHEGRTCPEHSNARYGLERRLHEATGVPSIILEADSHDHRLFSLGQLRRRLRDFLDQMAERPADDPTTPPS